ncbi:hypothetical protein PR048_018721 [Dryococelus australis]|uniref:Uncharacterized protein n=1 Tax=Dryococelus australis TaxID=614101 RepID=A0ABQ9HDU7_9NEOP|nr:hypothetical protein PR048_018721 [Dryococelus australis]
MTPSSATAPCMQGKQHSVNANSDRETQTLEDGREIPAPARNSDSHIPHPLLRLSSITKLLQESGKLQDPAVGSHQSINRSMSVRGSHTWNIALPTPTRHFKRTRMKMTSLHRGPGSLDPSNKAAHDPRDSDAELPVLAPTAPVIQTIAIQPQLESLRVKQTLPLPISPLKITPERVEQLQNDSSTVHAKIQKEAATCHKPINMTLAMRLCNRFTAWLNSTVQVDHRIRLVAEFILELGNDSSQ